MEENVQEVEQDTVESVTEVTLYRKVTLEPMTRLQYNEFRGWTLPEDENEEDSGFKVTSLENGHVSWSPSKIVQQEIIDPTQTEHDKDSVLESLGIHTDGELKHLINQAKELIKTRKTEAKELAKLERERIKNEGLEEALAKYAETNELGKRIYNFKEVSELTGVSTTRIKKALEAQQTKEPETVV